MKSKIWVKQLQIPYDNTVRTSTYEVTKLLNRLTPLISIGGIL